MITMTKTTSRIKQQSGGDGFCLGITRFHLLVCHILKGCHVQLWAHHEQLAVHIPQHSVQSLFLAQGVTLQLCRNNEAKAFIFQLLSPQTLTVCCQPNPGITDVVWKEFLEWHHHLLHLCLKQISQNAGIYLDKQEKLLCLFMRVQKQPFSLAQQLKCIERCCQGSQYPVS